MPGVIDHPRRTSQETAQQQAIGRKAHRQGNTTACRTQGATVPVEQAGTLELREPAAMRTTTSVTRGVEEEPQPGAAKVVKPSATKPSPSIFRPTPATVMATATAMKSWLAQVGLHLHLRLHLWW